jgi:CubicO group peptidase (beta-lactamase class C family)
MSAYKITDIKAREIIECRGWPTVQVNLHVDGNMKGRADVPAGRSKGLHEAQVLTDGDLKRYRGLGVRKAVTHVEGSIRDALIGRDVTEQRSIDFLMKALLLGSGIFSVALLLAQQAPAAQVATVAATITMNECLTTGDATDCSRIVSNPNTGGLTASNISQRGSIAQSNVDVGTGLANAVADDLAIPRNPEELGFSTARLGRITSWYKARVDAGDASGAVVTIAKRGKLVYLRAIGFQDHAKRTVMRADSIFWIASMTKPVTSVAAMILVDEGKVELDAPVGDYLPELKDMQVGVQRSNSATGPSDIVLEPPKRPMTVRDLLRHTSGLVYPPQYVNDPINKLYLQARFDGGDTLAEFVASLASLPLAHQPGEVWEYSWGVDVLARLVEVASGQPFDRFLESHIFRPLHMVDTGFYVPKEKLDRLVEAPEPRESAFDVTRPRNLLSGGGGLVSTAPDYLRFCQMLLNGGQLDGVRILRPRTVQLMTTDALPAGVRFVGDAIGPALGSSFGLGFAVRTDSLSSSVPGAVGSFAWSGLWGTYFWVDPTEEMIVISMAQIAPPAKTSLYKAAIRNLAYGALQVPQRTEPSSSPVAVAAETLAEYVGTYDFGRSSSARDRLASSALAGIGATIELNSGKARIHNLIENATAAQAGLKPGDVITAVDDLPLKDPTISEVSSKLSGPVNSTVRLTIAREGDAGTVVFTVTRAVIYTPGVELEVRVNKGMLVIEETGTWPVLDFEKDKPVLVKAVSDHEFYVDGGDHTRIAFLKGAAGNVIGAIINPGAWKLEGKKLERKGQ